MRVRAQADYCPYFTAYSNGLCSDVANLPSSNVRGQSYGANSYCMDSALVHSGYVASSANTCHETRCTSSGQLEIQLTKADGTDVCYLQRLPSNARLSCIRRLCSDCPPACLRHRCG